MEKQVLSPLASSHSTPDSGTRPAARWVVIAAGLAATLAVAGCAGEQSGEEPEPREVADQTVADGGEPSQTHRPPRQEIVELDPEEAAREAEEARQGVSADLMDGLTLDLWASDRLLGDPVAMDVDEQGRVFVTQTTRHRRSEFDIRDRPDWRIPSVTWTSVEDRRAFLREELSPERSEENQWLRDLNEDGSHDWRDLTVLEEKVFRIEDRSGDGVADRSQLFFEGFNEEVSDIAAGVLAYGEDTYVTVAPDLWRLRDTTGDGWADEKESVAHGFGVHVGFSGHGLSGPVVGPDGRIYWAIGDYGANVTDQEGRKWEYPFTGVIARVNSDGSDFEIYASGLRNTHEFAFDQYGNLISVDNDGDHPGEHERIVYLVNGSDSGWRITWQIGKYGDTDNNNYNPWMDEELFKPRFEGQAAYILPSIAAFRSGPSGMAYNPGTALSDQWKNFVFVSRFVGAPPRSGITGFQLEPSGAGFELGEQHNVLSGLLPTSLAFGPDGALYFSDWVQGWTMNGRGRIWRLDTPEVRGSELRREVKALLAEDFGARAGEELFELIQHEDMRVRRKAQFELAGRGEAGAEFLRAAAIQTTQQLGRIHAIWGIGQLIRQEIDQGEFLTELLDDADSEVRAQTAKTLGDVRHAPAASRLVELLEDDVARVRFFATEALGRIAYTPAVGAIAEMLVENDDEDVYLRHAGAIALARIGQAEPLVAFASSPSRALRLAAIVALRRMEDPGVAAFLADEDELLVTEAARAINDDRSIPEALPALARLLEEDDLTAEPLLRRIINANLRVGGTAEADRVAAYAAREDVRESMRVEALQVLGVWSRPSILDRVDGRHRGAVERDPEIARNAVGPVVDTLLTGDASSAVRIEAIRVASRFQIEDAAPKLLGFLREHASADVRVAALDGLEAMESDLLPEAVAYALADTDSDVRNAGLRVAPTLRTAGGQLVEMLTRVVHEGEVSEQQTALAALGRLGGDAEAQSVLDGMLDRLIDGEISPEIQLDLIEAADEHGADSLGEKLAQFEAARSNGDFAATHAELLYGGGIDPGRRLFRDHPSTSCARCHAVDGRGGDAGPDLTKVGARSDRATLLQALIEPNARISPGYGIVTLVLQNEESKTGFLREEADDFVELQVGNELKRISRNEIVEENFAPSSMPSMRDILTERELRDLVEYLASLK